MEHSLDELLKTEEQLEMKEQPSEDIFKNSKFKIKGICVALCLPAKKYAPKRTIDDIKKYLSEKSTRERILYSEVSSFIYGLDAEGQGNFATNIECLISYAFDEKNAVEEKYCKIIIKLYDHFQLALQQKSLNTNTNDVLKDYLVQSMSDAKDAITKDITEAAKVDTKKIEKQYITILGIFASVVLSFVGGLTFSSSVLQNINAVNVYRLLLIVDLLAIVLANTIYVLIKFICQINDKDFELFKMKWFNIVFLILGVLIIFAWVVDVGALAEFIQQWLPWI